MKFKINGENHVKSINPGEGVRWLVIRSTIEDGMEMKSAYLRFNDFPLFLTFY